MAVQNMSRADDERLLQMLRERIAGDHASTIAERHGLTRASAVRIATNRVLNADLYESGEPEHVVRAGYW